MLSRYLSLTSTRNQLSGFLIFFPSLHCLQFPSRIANNKFLLSSKQFFGTSERDWERKGEGNRITLRMSGYQGIGNNPVMGGAEAATGAALWPIGLGITNRADGDDECTCPNRGNCCSYCCGLPLFFSDEKGDKVGKQSTLRWNWCPTGWTMPEADANGRAMSFEGQTCSEGCCCCCEPQVVVYSGYNMHRKVGRAVRKCHCWACCNETMAEGYDANDKLRFKRVQNTSCCKDSYRKGGAASCWCCSCRDEFDYPVKDAAGNQVAVIRERSCCCPMCYGTWTGIPHFESRMSDDDKMLLMGMVFTKWWRGLDETKQADELTAGGDSAAAA